MLPIFSAQQIRAWDAYTIAREPISSYDLMERASRTFADWYAMAFSKNRKIVFFCGTGNNGGDGLAIARILYDKGYDVQIFICTIGHTQSIDFKKNINVLPAQIPIQNIHGVFPIVEDEESVIIDALLGSGLTRPLQGYGAQLVSYLNELPQFKIAVDIPTGLFADGLTQGVVLRANRVFSFQIPKLAFLMPDNQHFIHHFEFKSIGLHTDFIKTTRTHNFYMTHESMRLLLKPRAKFAHKGTFGHALLLVGSYGMAGAAILAAKACMRTGVGLLTVQSPECNRLVLQMSIPEAMFQTQMMDYQRFTGIGIGSGIGKSSEMSQLLFQLLKKVRHPIVLDADALNLLSEQPEWMQLLPENSILTPHLKEFERLFGCSTNGFERLGLLRERAKSLKINILLKGAHSIVATPTGDCYFNSTGNVGMATAGSGDVLMGMVTSLLAQGYSPSHALMLGVYLHGLAGDCAARPIGQISLMASDIIHYINDAYNVLYFPHLKD